jgi:hypothetical protein
VCTIAWPTWNWDFEAAFVALEEGELLPVLLLEDGFFFGVGLSG